MDQRQAKDQIEPPHALILPADRRDWFVRFFTRYTARLFRKRFHAVRLTHDSADAVRAAASHDGPIVVYGNHVGWWDPLLALLLNHGLLEGRPMLTVMHLSELQRFRFMRKLGVFGVDTDNTGSLGPMVSYISAEFEAQPRTALWVTPQGSFADVRAPLKLKPGTARLAAAYTAETGEPLRLFSLGIEYTFWSDQRPETLLRFTETPAPEHARTTTAWHRTMIHTMRDNLAALAQQAVARDESAFRVIAGSAEPRINPVYDAWLRLTRRRGALGDARRAQHTPGKAQAGDTHAEPASP